LGVRFGGTSFSTFFDTWNHVAKSGVVSKCLWGGSPLQDIGVAKRGRSFEPLFGVLLAEAKPLELRENFSAPLRPKKGRQRLLASPPLVLKAVGTSI